MGKGSGYRLEAVRDVRARGERVKRGELAGAVGDARTTEAAVARAAERVAAAETALATARGAAAPSTAAAITRLDAFVARLRKELALARDAHARAAAAHAGQVAAVTTAQQRFAHARAERELIERHFTQWRTERRKAAERREE